MVTIFALNAICPAYSSAQDSPETEALKSCDRALELADLALKDQRELSGVQSDLILRQAKGISELQQTRDSIWNSPVLWTVVGAVLGVGLTVGAATLVKEINR